MTISAPTILAVTLQIKSNATLAEGTEVGRLYQADRNKYNKNMNYKRLYIPNTLIFLTIVTHHRNPILINNISLLKQSFFNTKKFYQFNLIAYSIQPDHIHCIIKPKNISEYPKIIKSFKYSFTKNVGLVKPTYEKIWQKRYWEHTIKDENDLKLHLNYIHYNPVKHNLIDSVKNWKYSSFEKYIQKGFYDVNWGKCKDIENIKNLNFE